MTKINVGFIGCGYWGPNLIRNMAQLPMARIEAICDTQEERLEPFKDAYPDVKLTTKYAELLNDSRIDAVVIATPAHTHYKFAKDSLLLNKHVLVEKPLALSVTECNELIGIARKNNRILMAGHTFIYNAAVNKVKEYIDSGELGHVYYIYSQRLNLGRVRNDINAMWNFSPHDISIILYWLNKEPIRVSAKGFSYLQPEIEDVAFLTLEFREGVMAHIHISWLDPNKTRMMTVVGSNKMIVYDDVSTNAKIKLYDKGFLKKNNKDGFGKFQNFAEFQLIQRAGNLIIPKFDFIEPLYVECKHFLDCIKNNKKPITDGVSGLRVVRVLEAAQKSMDKGGVSVEIEGEK